MICYKDMTFCSSDCKNKKCFRFFGEKEKEDSRKWWNHNPDHAPVAFSDFSDSCLGYQK